MMLSESQERMLLVAEKGREQEIFDVFIKWGLDATIVGTVIAEPRLRVLHKGQVEADIPNQSLTDDAPRYCRPVGVWKAPVSLDPPAEVLEELKKPRDYTADLKKLLASSNICDKRWVFEQYDSMVQTNTVQGPGGEAGVMRIKGTHRGLAMALAGNSRWCYLDPRLGAMHAVAEAARKVACTGATPVAATNCLNFGNPEKPEIMAQLSEAIDGIAEACTALGTPITGGNVSLYNETRGEGIYPTPIIGIVGIIDDVTKAIPADFQREGDAVVLLTLPSGSAGAELVREFGSSEYAKTIFGKLWGVPPRLDLTDEHELHRCLAALAEAQLLHSVSDISDGGLALALAEASFRNEIGAQIQLQPHTTDLNYPDACRLFVEETTQVVLTCAGDDFETVKDMVDGYGFITVIPLGVTGGTKLDIAIGDRTIISATIADLKRPWSQSLKQALHDHTANEVLA
jgi:phosphoribosylformylglycinamidine synthase subunit PurL